MLPPGLGFNAVSDKALRRAKTNKMPRSYWDWEEMLKPNANGFFPYTPATNLLYGLQEALAMLLEEGLDQSSPAISALPQRPAPRSRIGALKCCAGTGGIFAGADRRADAAGPRRRPFRKIILEITTCRSAPGLGKSPARCSASAISASATN